MKLCNQSFAPVCVSFRQMCSFGFVLALCVLLVNTAICAEEANTTILAGDVKISTPNYKPNLTPPLGTYTYEVSWQGIPAAEVKVGVERPADDYQIWTKAKTYGLVDIFYTLRYNADATLTAEDFHPLRSYFYQRENSRIRETTLVFESNGDIQSLRVNKGQKEEYSFNSDNFTLDPFSASFVARGMEWKEGAVFQLDAFNGKSRYLITLTAVDRIKRNFAGILRDVWVIEPKVQTLTSKKQSKLRSAKIFLTADERKEILEIQSEVFIGTVKTKLVGFKPSEKSVTNTRLAMQGANKVSKVKK